LLSSKGSVNSALFFLENKGSDSLLRNKSVGFFEGVASFSAIGY